MIDMSKKELSPFAPDRWIRQLNRMIPNLWTDLRKTYADPTRLMKPDSGAMELLHFVPEWDFMPTMFPFFLCTVRYGEAYYLQHMNEIMTIATLYTWRVSKGVYRFAPEVYDALVNQPLSGDLPCDCLYRLPEWAVYIEAPGLMFERVPLEGFIAHLDYNLFSRDIDLQFALFAKNCDQPRMVALPMGTGSLADALERVDAIDKAFIPGNQPHYVGAKEEYRYTFSAMLQLLLYLCSDEPDMPPIEHPQKRRSASWRVYPPDEPKVWDVGVRISNVIRGYRHETTLNEQAETTSEQSHASPRPHVRSAHWHTYWTGPRDAVFPDRKPVIRWLPPMPIGMDWKRELPTNIRRVVWKEHDHENRKRVNENRRRTLYLLSWYVTASFQGNSAFCHQNERGHLHHEKRQKRSCADEL